MIFRVIQAGKVGVRVIYDGSGFVENFCNLYSDLRPANFGAVKYEEGGSFRRRAAKLWDFG